MSFIGYCEKAASGDFIGIPSVIAWAMINRSKGSRWWNGRSIITLARI